VDTVRLSARTQYAHAVADMSYASCGDLSLAYRVFGDEITTDLTQRFGGTVVKSTGDGHLTTFDSPVGTPGLSPWTSARYSTTSSVMTPIVIEAQLEMSESSHRTRSIAAMTAGLSGPNPSARKAWRSSSSTPSWTRGPVVRFPGDDTHCVST
jgi:class 3 adenylate cyclase